MNVTQRQLFILYYIYKGYLKPVDKLVNKDELNNILDTFSFHGEIYSLPYLIFTNDKVEGCIECMFNGDFVCNIQVESTYTINFEDTVTKMFKTSDIKHPGVADFMSNEGSFCLSGKILDFDETSIHKLNIPYIEPNFRSDYAFQSRNPPHSAHEAIVKHYLGSLLYSTPFSTTKNTDYSFDIKIKCYEKLKEIYGIDILVTLLPRVFAGPREALQNSLLFKNFGCKYFIGGRGKNCVGDYYTPTESMDFCAQYEAMTGINIIHEATQYVDDVELRASEIKAAYIDKGLYPPETFMSKYISEILINDQTNLHNRA
jgi:sulfate adenylyltransferase